MVFNRNRITRTFNNAPRTNNISSGNKINYTPSEITRTNSLSNSSLSISGGGSIPSNDNSSSSIKSSNTKIDGTWLDNAVIGIGKGINDFFFETRPESSKYIPNDVSGELAPTNIISDYKESSSPQEIKEKASGTDFMSGTDLQGRQDAHEKLHPSIVSKPRPYKKGMEALGISSNDSMVWGTKQDSVVSNLQFQKNTKQHSGMIDQWQKDILTNPSRDQAAANTWLNTQLGTIDAMEGTNKNKQMFKKDLTARYDNLFNTRNAPFQSNNLPPRPQGLTRDEKKALKIQAKKDEEQRALFTLSGQSGPPPPQSTRSTQGPTNLTDEYSNLGNRGSIAFTLGLRKNSNKTMDGYVAF